MQSSASKQVTTVKKSRGGKAAVYSLLLLVILVAFTLLFDVHGTGKLIHETLGILIILLVGYHIYHNAWFFKQLFNKNKNANPTVKKESRYSNPYFIFFDLTIVLMVIDFVAVIITGIMTSQIYFRGFLNALSLPSSAVVRPYHALAVFLLFPLIGLHLGLHLQSLISVLKSVYNKTVVLLIKLGFILMAIHGLVCFTTYNFAPKFSLIRSKSFRITDPNIPSWLFICDLVCMGAVFVIIGYVLANFLLMMRARKES